DELPAHRQPVVAVAQRRVAAFGAASLDPTPRPPPLKGEGEMVFTCGCRIDVRFTERRSGSRTIYSCSPSPFRGGGRGVGSAHDRITATRWYLSIEPTASI